MGERTSYAPGTFSWAELATSEPEAAKQFYTSVLGWEYEDNPVGEGQVYSMALRDGRYVAALYGVGDQPPHWNCYVTVASVDESAPRAAELGGRVLAEPFNVIDVGRMAVIADPAGAALSLWEPRRHIGASLVNAPGAMTWNDLVTPDPDGAARFYGELFGWTATEIPDAGGYRVIRNGERSNGGIMPLDPERMGAARRGEAVAGDGARRAEAGRPSWMPYFGHEDVERMVGEVGGLGGRVLSGPMHMPQGTIAVFSDPQGAVFALWTGSYED